MVRTLDLNLVTEPSVLETVLKSNLEKDDIYRFMWQVVGNGSVFAPVSVWKHRRKMILPLFNQKILSTFFSIFLQNSETLCSVLSKFTDAGEFSIWRFINAYSFDATMETTIGVKIDALQNPDNTFLNAVNESQNCVAERIFHVWLHPNFIYKFHPSHERIKKCIKTMNDFVDNAIQNKREQILDKREGHEVKSILDHLISMNEIDHSMDDLELREEVLMLIIAATDTAAVSVGFTLKLLAKYPHVQDKVYEELQGVLGDTKRPLQREDLSKLDHLHRVIQESLRLYPSVPFIARKIEKDTLLHDGSILPAGSGFLASIWGTHRNPKYWGQDAECFDPDRFLPHRNQQSQSRCFLPFSFGPRNCIGYQYAMMSMKTTLATLLRQYKIVGEPESGPKPNIRVKWDIMMKAADGFKVALERR
ncbi:cytochrome P450 4C1-like [Zerene cesonia]|uniref:cytochrome P450 4C1-like n=1 Tax=Zerene cesonia TaxID=33412 RepID=UPI0018E4F92B|nr:cytochrome P450 4C1-like [Zerene cesonia]